MTKTIIEKICIREPDVLVVEPLEFCPSAQDARNEINEISRRIPRNVKRPFSVYEFLIGKADFPSEQDLYVANTRGEIKYPAKTFVQGQVRRVLRISPHPIAIDSAFRLPIPNNFDLKRHTESGGEYVARLVSHVANNERTKMPLDFGETFKDERTYALQHGLVTLLFEKGEKREEFLRTVTKIIAPKESRYPISRGFSIVPTITTRVEYKEVPINISGTVVPLVYKGFTFTQPSIESCGIEDFRVVEL